MGSISLHFIPKEKPNRTLKMFSIIHWQDQFGLCVVPGSCSLALTDTEVSLLQMKPLKLSLINATRLIVASLVTSFK